MEQMSSSLPEIFRLLHKKMLGNRRSKRLREPSEALLYWEDLNERTDLMVSPRPFNMVARACLSSHASSAPAERLFSDLWKKKNRQA